MNQRLVLFLTAIGGTVAGGFAYITSAFSVDGEYLIECASDDGDCVLAASPDVDQCAVLLEGGGDRPGEISGLSGDRAKAAKDLYAMLEANVISGFKTLAKDNGCLVAIRLTREQAREWQYALTGQQLDAGAVGNAVAILSPASALNLPIQWSGGSTPEERTDGYNLSSLDGGIP